MLVVANYRVGRAGVVIRKFGASPSYRGDLVGEVRRCGFSFFSSKSTAQRFDHDLGDRLAGFFRELAGKAVGPRILRLCSPPLASLRMTKGPSEF